MTQRPITFPGGRQVCPPGQGTYQMGSKRSEEIAAIRKGNIIAIPKASSIAHVEENARSLDLSLTEEDLNDIDKAFPAPTHKIHLAGW